MTTFKLWAFSCPHLTADAAHGRYSLVECIQQMEPTGWDVAVMLGDFSADQGLPNPAEGQAIIDQFAAGLVGSSHSRGDIYCLMGNHDASGPGENNIWWQTYVNPMGQTNRPYPIEPGGTYDRYAFKVGNLRILMISDRNDGDISTGGRGTGGGGYPAGRMTSEQYAWLRGQVKLNPDDLIIVCNHHMLMDTTTATGLGEGVAGGYHGSYPQDAAGASFLSYVGDEVRQRTVPHFLQAYAGRVGLWIGGHTHLKSPVDSYGGKGPIEQAHGGTWFVQCGGVTQYHGSGLPMSKLLTFTDGSDLVEVETFIHVGTTEYPAGFYAPAGQTVQLRQAAMLPPLAMYTPMVWK